MYTGSLVGKGSLTFAVWGYVISHACKGYVELNPSVLAFLIGDDEKRVTEAIELFCAPDPKSRTQDHEGRRLLREGEYLYRVVNHEKYRDTRDEDARREYMRGYMRERRDESAPTAQEPKKKREPVPKPTQSQVEDYCSSIGLPRTDGSAMFLHWEEKGWGKVRNWKLTIQKWQAFGYLPSQKQQGGKSTVTNRQIADREKEADKAKLAQKYDELRRRREADTRTSDLATSG